MAMGSEREAPEFSSFFERLLGNRDLYMFLPPIVRFSNDNNNNDGVSRENSESPTDQGTPLSQRERMIFVNPFTQSMLVIEGASNLEALLGGLGNKDGQPPASKSSIEAMPSVEIGGSEDGECVVCLEEWKPGEVVKEMPCKHKFHDECIEKWLRIHGSCPVCRYKMPVDDEQMGKKREEEREILFRFSISNGRRDGENDQVPSTDSSNVSSSPDEQ